MIMQRMGRNQYRVKTERDHEVVLDSMRVKPYISMKGERDQELTPPLHYYSDSDFLVESDTYILENVLDHREVGRSKNKRYEWYVKYRGYPEPEWQPATSFLHDINEDWRTYNTKHGIDLTLSQVRTLQAKTTSHACYRHNTDVCQEMEAPGSVTMQGRADVLQEEQ